MNIHPHGRGQQAVAAKPRRLIQGQAALLVTQIKADDLDILVAAEGKGMAKPVNNRTMVDHAPQAQATGPCRANERLGSQRRNILLPCDQRAQRACGRGFAQAPHLGGRSQQFGGSIAAPDPAKGRPSDLADATFQQIRNTPSRNPAGLTHRPVALPTSGRTFHQRPGAFGNGGFEQTGCPGNRID